MVNFDMFKDAFVPPKKQAPAPAPQPQYGIQPIQTAQPAVAYAPTYPTTQPSQADAEVEKLRLMMLKWLSVIIGGSAILLIVWRVVLKFV